MSPGVNLPIAAGSAASRYIGFNSSPPTASKPWPHTRQPAPLLSHHQFWMGASKTAAQHACGFEHARPILPAVKCEASTSGSTGVTPAAQDLLIVGPGVLGSYLGKLWADVNPGATVYGQTNSTANHARLKQLGLIPRLKSEADGQTFANVVFCAPPSGSDDYVAEVRAATQLWDRSGTFIFTSSTGVNNVPDGGTLTEDTPLHPAGTSDRVDRLLNAEQAVLDAGGCVVRLVGLYHAQRGAHTFFLRQGEVPQWGGHLVNLTHYEDAAGLCLKVLQAAGSDRPYRQRVFLGTDASPLTFQEMMDAVLQSGAFEGTVKFTGPAESKPAPASCNKATQNALNWRPKYPSFKAFMAAGAQDFYSSSPAFAS